VRLSFGAGAESPPVGRRQRGDPRPAWRENGKNIDNHIVHDEVVEKYLWGIWPFRRALGQRSPFLRHRSPFRLEADVQPGSQRMEFRLIGCPNLPVQDLDGNGTPIIVTGDWRKWLLSEAIEIFRTKSA